MEPKITTLTVRGFIQVLESLKRQGQVTDSTEIWVSSDEEGNSFSPVIRVGDELNIGTEEDKSKLTIYPSSAHST